MALLKVLLPSLNVYVASGIDAGRLPWCGTDRGCRSSESEPERVDDVTPWQLWHTRAVSIRSTGAWSWDPCSAVGFESSTPGGGGARLRRGPRRSVDAPMMGRVALSVAVPVKAELGKDLRAASIEVDLRSNRCRSERARRKAVQSLPTRGAYGPVKSPSNLISC